MARGHNSTTLHHTLKVIRMINDRQNEENKTQYHRNDFIHQALLNLWKRNFLKFYSEEEWNEELARYSVTAEERNEKALERKRKQAEREERKLRLEEQKIQLALRGEDGKP